MARLELLSRHRLAVALAAGAVLGLAIGAAIPPPGPDARASERHRWRLPGPQAVARVDEAEFARLRAAPIWGGASAEGPTVKAASWRLVAIMNRPEPVALVDVGSAAPMLRLKAGDPLPDGATIRSVDANGLSFVRGGCAFARTLYSATDTPLDGSCAAPPPAAAAKSPDQPAQ